MFTAFVSAFCIGSVILGVLYILVPDGKLNKAVSYAFSIALLCVVLSGAVKLSDVQIPGVSESRSDFDNERLSAASAEMVFAEALSREKINFSKITVFTDKSGSGGISITKVFVYTAESADRVNSAIGSDIYEVVVINE